MVGRESSGLILYLKGGGRFEFISLKCGSLNNIIS